MTGRPSGHLAQSPLEAVALPIVIGLLAGGGLLWGSGVVVGSILGATLPGTPADGIVAMLRVFPDVGVAWQPAVPSLLIWAAALLVAALLSPLLWKLATAGRLRDQGAQWATRNELRRAGLLVPDRTPAHAVPEPAADDA